MARDVIDSPKLPDWQKLYRAALSERNLSELMDRIEQAETAILKRRISLRRRSDNQEILSLNAALAGLNILRRGCARRGMLKFGIDISATR